MKNLLIKILAAVAYVAMVTMNYLANALPINNRGTGQISDAYANLFAPAGLTFSIWGLIYLLLAVYVLHQFSPFGKKSNRKKEEFLAKINLLFIATSLTNISWILAWHYDFIWLSVLIMAFLLISLIRITDLLRLVKMTAREKLYILTPFSIYFGWITVAAIANVTVFLVSIGWDGFGIAEHLWTMIILLVGALIGILRLNHDRHIAYGLVLVWAYFGILFKHLSPAGFNEQYPGIIGTVIVCLMLFVFFTAKTFYQNKQR